MVIFLPFIEAIAKKFATPVYLLVKESSKASQILKSNKNIKIFTEVDISYLEDAGSSYDQFIDLLTENNFTLYLMDNRSETLTKVNRSQLEKILNDESSVNIFCVRELNS